MARSANPFAAVRRAEAGYARNLRQIARQIGQIVRGYGATSPQAIRQINQALRDYARLLSPWAQAIAQRMIADVARRDTRAWTRLSTEIGAQLRRDVIAAPWGGDYLKLMDDQVGLITSLPQAAAEHIHDVVTSGMTEGRRWEDIAREIWLKTPDVTKNRANLIARTEVGRATTTLTQARAQHLGSSGYVWRTALDADVRPLHRRLEGTFHLWSHAPIAGERGERAHPGAIYNCRCYPEVVLPGVVPGAPPRGAGPGPRPRAAIYRASLTPEAEPYNEAYRQGNLSRAQYEAALKRIARAQGIS